MVFIWYHKHGYFFIYDWSSKARFRFQKFLPQNITSNLAAHARSTKCRRKKLIAQLGEKSRDETFKSN